MAFRDFFNKLVEPKTLQTLGYSFMRAGRVPGAESLALGEDQGGSSSDEDSELQRLVKEGQKSFEDAQVDPAAVHAAAVNRAGRDLHWYYSNQARMRNEGLNDDNPLPSSPLPGSSAFHEQLMSLIQPQMTPYRRKTAWSNL